MSDIPVRLIPFVRRPPNCVLILQVRVISQHSDVSSISHRWRSSILPFYYYFNYYVHNMHFLFIPFSLLYSSHFHFLYARYNLLKMEGKRFQYFCCESLRAVQKALFLAGFVKVFMCTGLVSRQNGIGICWSKTCTVANYNDLKFLAFFSFFYNLYLHKLSLTAEFS